jgi:hypothetical protein
MKERSYILNETVSEYLLRTEITRLQNKEELTNQEECWLESCERELLLSKQLQLSNICYYGCSRDEFKEKIKDYTINH